MNLIEINASIFDKLKNKKIIEKYSYFNVSQIIQGELL